MRFRGGISGGAVIEGCRAAGLGIGGGSGFMGVAVRGSAKEHFLGRVPDRLEEVSLEWVFAQELHGERV